MPTLQLPLQCHLWKKEHQVIDGGIFELLETFIDESHLTRKLVKCKQCGQLYFYEFYEEIDWKEGNDPQYRTYVPVSSQEEAMELSKLTQIQLLQYIPRFQCDFSKEDSRGVCKWIGK